MAVSYWWEASLFHTPDRGEAAGRIRVTLRREPKGWKVVGIERQCR